MSKIGFPQLPSVGVPVSPIKRWSLLSHPYFTGSGNDINPFPREQLQLKSHIAKLCPQDIEKWRRVKGSIKGRRQASCEITKWKTMRCILVLNLLKVEKSERAGNRFVPQSYTFTTWNLQGRKSTATQWSVLNWGKGELCLFFQTQRHTKHKEFLHYVFHFPFVQRASKWP